MKIYQNVMLMSDLDGTLANSHHQVSEKNKQAIAYFVEQGGHFAVATGRTVKNVVPYMAGLVVNTPCILYNGGALYDWQEQRFLKTRHLESGILAQYLKHCIGLFPKMCVEIFTSEQLYVVTDPHNVDEHMEREKQEFQYAGMDDITGKPWIKVILCDTHEHLLACRDLLPLFHLEAKTNNFFSAEMYLEIVGKDVSKGSMLRELLSMEPYRHKTVVAAGDFQNDIAMLRLADCGVAPANAQLEVREAADVVAVSNDADLLYDIIYRILPKLLQDNAKRNHVMQNTDGKFSFT